MQQPTSGSAKAMRLVQEEPLSRAAIEAETARLFDRFVEAFATFEGNAVRRLFASPGVALRRDGTLRGFADLNEIEGYYQDALDRYRASGCRSCRYSDLEIDVLSDMCVVAKVSWDLLREDGSVLSHWRQAYFVSQTAGEWRIFGSAFVSG
jgi:hypothetical protein